MGEKNKGGRPPIYKNPEDLSGKIDVYFAYIKGEYVEKQKTNLVTREMEVVREWIREPERITITGLGLFLGCESKSRLYEYAKKPKFSYPIKRAIAKVEQAYEAHLFERNSTGAIFALKNFGWTDKQEIDHTSAGQPFAINITKTYKSDIEGDSN